MLRHYELLGEGDRPTDDGRWAALLRLDHPLLVALAIRAGEIAPERPIVGLAAALAGGDREYRKGAKLRGDLLRPLLDLQNRAREIERVEREAHIFRIPVVNFGAAWAIDHIVRGLGWPDVDCDEGDLVRLAWRTVDVLRQLGNLVDTHPDLAHEARRWMRHLKEDPVLVID